MTYNQSNYAVYNSVTMEIIYVKCDVIFLANHRTPFSHVTRLDQSENHPIRFKDLDHVILNQSELFVLISKFELNGFWENPKGDP